MHRRFHNGRARCTYRRGVQIGGALEDIFESDDSRIRFDPGITINSDEAPVRLISDGTLPSDSPTSLKIVMESQAGTPGLTGTLEAWNYDSTDYDVVDVSATSFNNDAIVVVDLSSGISDYVQAETELFGQESAGARPDLRSTSRGKFVWTKWFGSREVFGAVFGSRFQRANGGYSAPTGSQIGRPIWGSI